MSEQLSLGVKLDQNTEMEWYCYLLGIVLSFAIVFTLISFLPSPKKYITSRDGAMQAIGLIQEWAKWVSGIQTLSIGGLAWFAFDDHCLTLNHCPEKFLALLAFAMIGSAIFCSAWILSSLPLQAMKIHNHLLGAFSPEYDIYEKSLLGNSKLTLGYCLTVNHWLWGVGLGSFGILVIYHLLRTI
ncbi:hypothetical protein [Dyadobacter sp. CY326]|uniref:hypothetical protein n=1 Tax=Dyadobacter sp. CY326 TaxID=2907300 RepID=UPI001F2EF7D6|nr:hypothetical protein [Dyadobacter sp. CY326]MCE7067184.1 hypothetical protein [Dyadobacter sp. CY326]